MVSLLRPVASFIEGIDSVRLVGAISVDMRVDKECPLILWRNQLRQFGGRVTEAGHGGRVTESEER